MLDRALHRRGGYDDLVLSALRRHPDRVAFVVGARQMSYREVERETARTAAALTGMGVGQHSGVMLLSGNRPEAFTTMLATLSVGARYTPLPPLGSVEDQEFILRDAEAAVLVFDGDLFAARAAELAARVPEVRLLPLTSGSGADDAADSVITGAPLGGVNDEDDVALIGYTGGTTGRPKGVVLSHRALLQNAMLALVEWQLPQDVRFLGVTPLSHALGLCIAPILLRGGRCVLLTGFDPPAVLRAIAEHQITATSLVPTMLYALLDEPTLSTTDVSSVETIIYGAAPMDPGRLRQALERFGPVFVQSYGQSEAPNAISVLRKEDHRLDRSYLLSSCGQPLPGNTVAILDDDDQPVATGELGEICIRGPLVMDGYWRLPEQTAGTLRHDWLHTGDIGRVDSDGYLYLVDRKKDMVITGGFNVYPREVEDVLMSHPDVSRAAVIGVPDRKWGEAVTAFVTRRAGGTVTEAELVALVRDRKGPVAAPKSVVFADVLPLTPLGKVDKNRLKSSASPAEPLVAAARS